MQLSSIQGNNFQLGFVMDDGSILRVMGALEDVTEARIQTVVMNARGGKCGSTTPYAFVVRDLDRQN
jgi:hypothetical protein